MINYLLLSFLAIKLIGCSSEPTNLKKIKNEDCYRDIYQVQAGELDADSLAPAFQAGTSVADWADLSDEVLVQTNKCLLNQKKVQDLDLMEYEMSCQYINSEGSPFRVISRYLIERVKVQIDSANNINESNHFKFKINKPNGHYYLQSFLNINDIIGDLQNEIMGFGLMAGRGGRSEVDPMFDTFEKLEELERNRIINLYGTTFSIYGATTRLDESEKVGDIFSQQSSLLLFSKIMHQISCIQQNQKEFTKMRIIKTVLRFNHNQIKKMFDQLRRLMIQALNNGDLGEQITAEGMDDMDFEESFDADLRARLERFFRSQEEAAGGKAVGMTFKREFEESFDDLLLRATEFEGELSGPTAGTARRSGKTERTKDLEENKKHNDENGSEFLLTINRINDEEKFFKQKTVENYRLLTNIDNLVNNIYTKNSTKNSQHLMEIEVEIDFK